MSQRVSVCVVRPVHALCAQCGCLLYFVGGACGCLCGCVCAYVCSISVKGVSLESAPRGCAEAQPSSTLFLMSSHGQAGRRLRIRPRAVLAGGKGSGGARDQVCAGCSRSLPTSLSLSSVTLQRGICIFDPQGSFWFHHSHLYHTDSSQIHAPGSSVPRWRDLGWLCGPTASLAGESSRCLVACSHSPDPQSRGQPLRTKSRGWHCQVQSVGWWAFQRGWGRAYGTCLKSGHQAPGSRGGLAPGARQG